MRVVFWAALAAFCIDQLSKYIVIHLMSLVRIREIDVLSPLLTFRYGENRGMNFGLFDGEGDTGRWILIALAFVICGAVLFWLWRNAFGVWARLSAGLLIGGALANVADRLVYGYVLDFLNMSCCGIRNPYVFNVADVFIFAGAAGLVFLTGEPGKPRPKVRKKGQ